MRRGGTAAGLRGRCQRQHEERGHSYRNVMRFSPVSIHSPVAPMLPLRNTVRKAH
jgi:hypothetical protein